MRKLLLILLFLSACKEPSSEKKVAKVEGNTVKSLPIEESGISQHDQKFIAYADNVTKDIDNNSKSVKTLDTTVVYKGLPTDIRYIIHVLMGSKEIGKIASYGSNKKQKLIYIYYYSNGEVIKSMTKIIDDDPFECSVYYQPDRAIAPKGISQRAANTTRNQAKLFFEFFKKRI